MYYYIDTYRSIYYAKRETCYYRFNIVTVKKGFPVVLYSFDVFDTLITRATATPRGIFALVDKRLQVEQSDISRKILDSFYNARLKAEKAARKIYCEGDIQDVTLDQIYHMLGTITMLSDTECDYLKNLELETEYLNSIPIIENIDKVKKLIRAGSRVILISDMYLSADQIRHILLKHDSVFKDINIYVSSELKKTKSSGYIYKVIRKKEVILWSDWTHIGDNVQSDCEVPLRLGMCAERYEFPQLSCCEEEILKNRYDQYMLQLFVGCSRNNRIKNDMQIAKEFGGMYGAAILLQYMLWIVGVCKKKGITKLYFVARDGFVLYKIAELLKKKKIIDWELEYIYGSRKAWVTSGDIANDIDNKIDYVKDDSELKLLRAYIKQVIDLNAEQIGFVEVHGRGETQLCFARLIREMSAVKMSAFYYGLERDQDDSLMDFYRFTQEKSENGCVIEALTRALHGRTVGYSYDNGAVIPVLTDDEGTALKEYGYEDYISSLLLTIENYLNVMLSNSLEVEQFPYGEEYHKYLVNIETGKMLDFIADLPLSDTVHGEEVILRFAPKPSADEIRDVRKVGYLKYKTWCPTISKRRLNDKELEKISRNTEIYKKRMRDKALKTHVGYRLTASNIKKRIVLYGNGKVGKGLYKYITDNDLAEIVAWTDANINCNDGIYVTRESLKNYVFDQIIIAVKSELLADDIRVDLQFYGIDNSLVYWENYEQIRC